jgi:hypothetical protein
MCNGIQIGFCLIHKEGEFYVSKENLDLCPKERFFPQNETSIMMANF